MTGSAGPEKRKPAPVGGRSRRNTAHTGSHVRIFIRGVRGTRVLERGHAGRPQFVRVFKREFRAFLSLAALARARPPRRVSERSVSIGDDLGEAKRERENTGSRRQITAGEKGAFAGR